MATPQSAHDPTNLRMRVREGGREGRKEVGTWQHAHPAAVLGRSLARRLDENGRGRVGDDYTCIDLILVGEGAE
jgi:hypothetical protein